jgi:hypothetical protein
LYATNVKILLTSDVCYNRVNDYIARVTLFQGQCRAWDSRDIASQKSLLAFSYA